MSISTLNLSRTSLIFNDLVGGINPAAQTVVLTDTTPGSPPATMNFTAVSDQPWLHVSPGAGSTPSSPPEVLTISVVTGILTLGAYVGHVVVTAPGAFASPQTITVAFNVGGGTIGGFAVIATYFPAGS